MGHDQLSSSGDHGPGPDRYHPSMTCLLGRMLFLAVAMTGPIAVACRFPIQPVLKGT